MSRKKEQLGEIQLDRRIQMAHILSGFYEYCDEPLFSVKEDKSWRPIAVAL
jgi:hypothetical protein